MNTKSKTHSRDWYTHIHLMRLNDFLAVRQQLLQPCRELNSCLPPVVAFWLQSSVAATQKQRKGKNISKLLLLQLILIFSVWYPEYQTRFVKISSHFLFCLILLLFFFLSFCLTKFTWHEHHLPFAMTSTIHTINCFGFPLPAHASHFLLTLSKVW